MSSAESLNFFLNNNDHDMNFMFSIEVYMLALVKKDPENTLLLEADFTLFKNLLL